MRTSATSAKEFDFRAFGATTWFLTTKVWTTHFAPNDLLRSTKDSLHKMRMSEVDLLLLLHWPNKHVPLSETLGGLARAREFGLTQHVGVSNFTVALLDEAVSHSYPCRWFAIRSSIIRSSIRPR